MVVEMRWDLGLVDMFLRSFVMLRGSRIVYICSESVWVWVRVSVLECVWGYDLEGFFIVRGLLNEWKGKLSFILYVF